LVCGRFILGRPAEHSGIPELPQWSNNICEQLRLTIFKHVLELQPLDEEKDWRTFGRMMGLCQRLAVYLKRNFVETDFKRPAAELKALASAVSNDANKPILVPPKDLLKQMEGAFIVSMDVALTQSSEDQFEFLPGLTEGYELFMDAHGQFSCDRGRTSIYFELLSRWQEIEVMRQFNPPQTCIDL
jgi:hypothetical protein